MQITQNIFWAGIYMKNVLIWLNPLSSMPCWSRAQFASQLRWRNLWRASNQERCLFSSSQFPLFRRLYATEFWELGSLRHFLMTSFSSSDSLINFDWKSKEINVITAEIEERLKRNRMRAASWWQDPIAQRLHWVLLLKRCFVGRQRIGRQSNWNLRQRIAWSAVDVMRIVKWQVSNPEKTSHITTRLKILNPSRWYSI